MRTTETNSFNGFHQIQNQPATHSLELPHRDFQIDKQLSFIEPFGKCSTCHQAYIGSELNEVGVISVTLPKLLFAADRSVPDLEVVNLLFPMFIRNLSQPLNFKA
jgi:hypothetical protein